MGPFNLDNLDNFNSLEDLQKELDKRVRQHNQGAKQDFEGLSPEQMHKLQVNFPDEASPLKVNKLSDYALKQSPLLNQVRFLIDKMKGGESIKLTKTGALNTKLVKELYAQGFLKNYFVEKGFSKVYKESNIIEIQIAHILLKISGLAKKRREKLSLTKTGEKYTGDGNFILKKIIYALFQKFNWAYFDGYDFEDIGRVNPAFSLYLLKKFGAEERNTDFYAEKYFKALPKLMKDNAKDFRCYKSRTFNWYFYFLGFVEKNQEKIFDPIYVKKTTFFDELIVLKSN